MGQNFKMKMCHIVRVQNSAVNDKSFKNNQVNKYSIDPKA